MADTCSKILQCENCSSNHDSSYGSGRFCSSKCARGFSTKEKRKEINKQVSKTLTGRPTRRYNGSPWKFTCEKCGKKFYDQDSYGGHTLHCVYGSPKLSKEGRKNQGWSRGLTKQTDARVMQYAQKLQKFSDEDLFVAGNTKHWEQAVRRAKERLPNVCVLCGQLPFWNGKPLTLRVDHINGDRFDCRWENLRIICYHCDSQLETFCSKNIAFQKKRNAGMAE